MERRKRLVILDTHAILHRAYHALPCFPSSKGEPTGALYGLISMLVKIINDLKPDYIAAAYDLPGKTYRHAAYEKYKATRAKTKDDLAVQINRARDVLRAFGIPLYEREGFEADDVIGTLVEKVKNQKDLEVIIASGDMDTLQLVSGERVRVFTFKKGLSETALYDEKAVKTRYGFGPSCLPDYKGLRGDPSDNIPGVRGIGEKTAAVLIAHFGSIEKLYAALKKEPKKVQALGVRAGAVQKLNEQEEEAKFSKLLCEIRRDVPMEFALPEKSWRESMDMNAALGIISELEFRSLIPRVREVFSVTVKPTVSFAKPDLEKAALAVWVLDSNITQPEMEDVLRVGRSNDFDKAFANIRQEIKERQLDLVYENIELPLMPVLRRMEERGVLIDKTFLRKLSGDYTGELKKIAAKIYEAAGGKFNINSPKQLGEVLFDKLGLSVKNQKKTAGGSLSTRESELHKLRALHPVIDDVLAHRELSKLLSTYINAIPALLDKKDRLHTHFVQTGTTTGRLSSQEPNLQNIPIKSDLGRAIRHAFVADKGMSLVSFDYSQIELRIAAFLSGDEALSDIFKKGRDVHAEVAARVFGVAGGEVTYEQRRAAKVINFGILYGMGVVSLQQSLGTSRREAQEFYDQYFSAFPRLAEYLEEVKADAARRGYTQTHFGRRRYFEGIKSSIPYVRAAAERMALNAPIQGTQADIVKLAMIDIDKFFAQGTKGLPAGRQGHLLLQVHDELLFEISEEEVGECAPVIKKTMESVLPEKERRGIPFTAEGKIGKNWGEMKNI